MTNRRMATSLVAIAVLLAFVVFAGVFARQSPKSVSRDRGNNDLIRVVMPTPGSTITSPLLVTGEARGTWYFEASFPVKLLDVNGHEIAVVSAQAQSDWMTTDFVPFKATLLFDKPKMSMGTLVLQKDNPSGLPEYDASIRIPVRFR